MTEIFIKDTIQLDEIKKAIADDGPEHLHLLSDFDRTLTYDATEGKKRPSLISILRDGNYLTPEYAAHAHTLYDQYSPLENDPNLSLTERKAAMLEWWTKHFQLLIATGLNKTDVQKVISSEKLQLRAGVPEFLDFLSNKNIPLIIMSSTGLGGEAISHYLQHQGRLHSNIEIISNFFIWDENGRAIDYRRPVLHALNKDETTLQSVPEIFAKVRDRLNVILLGDSLGDAEMNEGFPAKNIIKIGFYNDKSTDKLAAYKSVYDVLVMGDGNFSFIHKLLTEALKS